MMLAIPIQVMKHTEAQLQLSGEGGPKRLSFLPSNASGSSGRLNAVLPTGKSNVAFHSGSLST